MAASVAAARQQEEEAVAREEREAAEALRRTKEMQLLLATSPELQELQHKLQTAHVTAQRAQQLKEKAEIQEQVRGMGQL